MSDEISAPAELIASGIYIRIADDTFVAPDGTLLIGCNWCNTEFRQGTLPKNETEDPWLAEAIAHIVEHHKSKMVPRT